MKQAIIIVVEDESSGAQVYLVEGKTDESLKQSLMKKLPAIVRDFAHQVDGVDESISEMSIEDAKEEAEELLQGHIFCPSHYVGNGFVQVEYI